MLQGAQARAKELAAQAEAEERRKAAAQVCGVYIPPVYAHLRCFPPLLARHFCLFLVQGNLTAS
jgi:hypothetical protein